MSTLESIPAGPWKGGHPCDTWTLTRDEVIALLIAMPNRQKMAMALGVDLSSRKADRALQILRRAGLAEYMRGSGCWRSTLDGACAALAAVP